jgi:hypothetical protein
MIHPPARTLAAALAAGVLLTGCSTSDPTPGTGSTGNPSNAASASPSASTSASPTSTLTAEEQQAFAEATAVALAYRQTLVDLYSGARDQLNDLNRVTAGELLDRTLGKTQRDLGAGQRSEPEGVQLVLVVAEPMSVDLESDPNTVVLRACVDGTQVTSVSPSGERTSGVREQAEYTLTRMSYLPDPGWAVTRTQVAKDPGDRTC